MEINNQMRLLWKLFIHLQVRKSIYPPPQDLFPRVVAHHPPPPLNTHKHTHIRTFFCVLHERMALHFPPCRPVSLSAQALTCEVAGRDLSPQYTAGSLALLTQASCSVPPSLCELGPATLTASNGASSQTKSITPPPSLH